MSAIMDDVNLVAAAYGMTPDELRGFAVRLAERYHAIAKRLYTSAAAYVRYGDPKAVEDWDRYSRAWHRNHGPSRYKVAGVVVRLRDGLRAEMQMATTRGVLYAIPLPPPNAIVPARAPHRALYALPDGDVCVLYDARGKRICLAHLDGDGIFVEILDEAMGGAA